MLLALQHYVRNHGPVPRLDWETHQIQVNGLVDKPQSFTMDELISQLPSYTLPVTLVCAGNRRKEQNIVKKSKGFNWGPSGVSTAYWTGIRLCDLLRLCKIRRPSQGAKYVVYRGVKNELPQVMLCDQNCCGIHKQHKGSVCNATSACSMHYHSAL